VSTAGSLDTFSTERLRAERLRSDHLADLRRMDRHPVVMEHLGGVREDAKTLARFQRDLWHWDEYGYGAWVLYELNGQDMIGRAVLRHILIEGVDDVEVGYAFYPEFWGRGLATEISRACLGFARDPLHLATVIAVTTPSNLASQNVLRKIGLEFEREVVLEERPWFLFRTSFEPTPEPAGRRLA
jgi:RimJ/RimL family protein N-acetyltransferase